MELAVLRPASENSGQMGRMDELTMNVSWSDLNNVQEPGDYPFREGTITVTFVGCLEK
jgi:hypothetical protein